MSAPGTANELGIATVPKDKVFDFQVPCSQPADPNVNEGRPVPGGSRSDMGALVLCLVSNWFINGETVLIDGGVSCSNCDASGIESKLNIFFCIDHARACQLVLGIYLGTVHFMNHFVVSTHRGIRNTSLACLLPPYRRNDSDQKRKTLVRALEVRCRVSLYLPMIRAMLTCVEVRRYDVYRLSAACMPTVQDHRA